ncbi:MAG: hypothetical protein ACE366_01095 [Bradymonadia bacterium]
MNVFSLLFIRAIFAVSLLSWSSTALAQEDGSLRLDGELGYACISDQENNRIDGGYGAADFAYTPNAMWSFRAGYALARHDSANRAFTAYQPSVGVRYLLDVFTYVPWIEVSPTYFLTEGDAPYSGLSVAVGVGVDWLQSPETTIGVAVRAHALMEGEGEFPGYITIGVRLGRRWTLGDPFAP